MLSDVPSKINIAATAVLFSKQPNLYFAFEILKYIFSDPVCFLWILKVGQEFKRSMQPSRRR